MTEVKTIKIKVTAVVEYEVPLIAESESETMSMERQLLDLPGAAYLRSMIPWSEKITITSVQKAPKAVPA